MIFFYLADTDYVKFAGDVENGVKHNKMCFEILVTRFFGQNE